MAQRTLLPVLCAWAALSAGDALALGSTAEVGVLVRLGQRCVNLAWSAQTQARVEVACSNGDFVRIEPQPGRPFLGTRGDAHRFHFTAEALPSGLLAANAEAFLGAGTVTSLRIYNIQEDGGPLEMLVTF